MRSEEIIAICFQVGLIALFIGLFFFSYVAQVEQDVTTHQIHYIIDAFTSELSGFIPSASRDEIASRLANLQAPNLDALDNRVRANNEALKEKGYQILVIPTLASFIAICSYGLLHPLRKEHLFNIVASLGVVALTYFCFLNLVVNKYLSVDTNAIKRRILEILMDIAALGPSVNIAPNILPPSDIPIQPPSPLPFLPSQ